MGLRSGLCADQSSSSTPISTNHFYMDLTLCIRRTARWRSDSSIQRTRFYCSGVQWRQASHHSSRSLALRLVISDLCAAARPWTPKYCADFVSRGSLELCSECCNRGQTIFTRFSTRWSRSVSLCGLPLQG